MCGAKSIPTYDICESCADVPFVKHDEGKARLELLPPLALIEVAHVLAHGAAKYGADNWHKCEDTSRYIGAALRHILAHMRGETNDSETGRLHLAHAICGLLFVAELELRRNQNQNKDMK